MGTTGNHRLFLQVSEIPFCPETDRNSSDASIITRAFYFSPRTGITTVFPLHVRNKHRARRIMASREPLDLFHFSLSTSFIHNRCSTLLKFYCTSFGHFHHRPQIRFPCRCWFCRHKGWCSRSCTGLQHNCCRRKIAVTGSGRRRWSRCST